MILNGFVITRTQITGLLLDVQFLLTCAVTATNKASIILCRKSLYSSIINRSFNNFINKFGDLSTYSLHFHTFNMSTMLLPLATLLIITNDVVAMSSS
jgi:hypothetical protein